MANTGSRKRAAMSRVLKQIALTSTTENEARTLAKNLLKASAKGRRRTPIGGGSGQWTTEDIPEEGIPSLNELRARVMGSDSSRPASEQLDQEWEPRRRDQLAQSAWQLEEGQGAPSYRQEFGSPHDRQEQPRSQHWPTALVSLLPVWKDDITVSEAREKWTTFVAQFEKVIMMQPGAFSENQKRVLLTVKGGQMVQKLLEGLDTTEGVDGNNVYDKAKQVCSEYFESNSMKLVDMTTFRSTMQEKDEPFTSFVTRLRNKARVCQFGVEQESVEIAQQIMNGATDKKEFLNSAVLFPSMKLADLERLGTRFEMTRALRTCESSSVKVEKIAKETVEDQMVNALGERGFGRQERFNQRGGDNGRYHPYGRPQNGGEYRQQAGSSNRYQGTGESRYRGSQQEEYFCEQYCGRRHLKGRCFAYGKKCDQCGRVGHFKSVCKSAERGPMRVKQIEDEVKPDYFRGED